DYTFTPVNGLSLNGVMTYDEDTHEYAQPNEASKVEEVTYDFEKASIYKLTVTMTTLNTTAKITCTPHEPAVGANYIVVAGQQNNYVTVEKGGEAVKLVYYIAIVDVTVEINPAVEDVDFSFLAEKI
ncbi:MAG: hypothetical protein IJA69_01255, partial [Clostridia bacterium]|nr:hypothetical protein [Clostridia bacterium]